METLLAMPSAKGLFHRAIIESGAAIKVVDRDVALRNAEQLLAKLGIDEIECAGNCKSFLWKKSWPRILPW